MHPFRYIYGGGRGDYARVLNVLHSRPRARTVRNRNVNQHIPNFSRTLSAIMAMNSPLLGLSLLRLTV